jgi:hypothetical protein
LGGSAPWALGNRERLDLEAPPTGLLIACVMQLSVMAAAQRYGKLVADLHAQRSQLGKAQVMRVGWLPAADEARLRDDEFQMVFVAQPLGFGDGQNALVDLASDEPGEVGMIGERTFKWI